MPIRHSLLAAAVAAAVSVLTLAPGVAFGQSVSGEPLRIENTKREAPAAFKAATLAPAATLRFQPLAASRLSALQRHNAANGKRLQIGIERNVADEAEAALPAELAWTPVAGGQVLRFDVASPGEFSTFSAFSSATRARVRNGASSSGVPVRLRMLPALNSL